MFFTALLNALGFGGGEGEVVGVLEDVDRLREKLKENKGGTVCGGCVAPSKFETLSIAIAK